MAIRNNVRQVVYTKSKNQSVAATKTGVSRVTINKWVNGELDRRILETLDKLCSGLGVQVGDLFEYVPDEEAEVGDIIFEKSSNKA